MTFAKRLRLLYAAYKQEWHQKTCAECSFTWWSQGKLRPELIDICDFCESENMDRMLAHAERQYHMHIEYERLQRLKKGVRRA